VLKESVYAKLPIFLQDAACSYYGKRERKVRLGGLFQQRLEELMESERWSKGEIEAYQNEKLQQLVKHAYENVPYYREVMQNLRLTPQDIRTKVDLVKLPILTKEDVRQNGAKLLSQTARKRDVVFKHTSGTTGKSLTFYAGKASIAFQWAVWWRHRRRFGIDEGCWHANFTGKMVVPQEQRTPPYWRWNKPMHQALVNMQQLTPDKIGDIISFLNQKGFPLYTGYPSIIHAMTMAANDRGLSLTSPPKVIATGAENILEYQRRDIEKFTGAILTDQYGSSEGCGNASQCSEFAYHEDFEFGIIQCVEPETSDDGVTSGQVVCTGFASPEFPFIRYSIGDRASWADPRKSCSCGRESTVLVGIDGRKDDYVVTPEGQRIMRFDYVFKETSNVRECQVVQERLGEIKVIIVKRPGYGTKDEDFIRDEIRNWISPRLSVVFSYVSEIPRGNNGKFQAVKSLLNNHDDALRLSSSYQANT
jgi:phenylacetate-CoA ligase